MGEAWAKMKHGVDHAECLKRLKDAHTPEKPVESFWFRLEYPTNLPVFVISAA